MKVTDSHTDFLTALDNEGMNRYANKISKKVKLISSAVFTTEKGFIPKEVEEYKEIVDKLNRKHKNKFLFSIEDIGVFKTREDLDLLIKLKPFSITLTWNYENEYAGGAYSKLGLTKLGVETVKILEEKGILIDTAHLSRRAFWDLTKRSNFPKYNSHANIYSLTRHKRNLTDKQIQKIVDTNGYLGITLYRDFCIGKSKTKEFTAKDIALQFDYLIKHFGHRNFGFGTDFYGIDVKKLPTDLSGYEDLKKVAVELKKMGYSTSVVKDIFYRNFLDFIKRINTK